MAKLKIFLSLLGFSLLFITVFIQSFLNAGVQIVHDEDDEAVL